MEYSIISKDIKKNFSKKSVLRDINFSIKNNNIVLLSGKNGSGKTTWIKIALGLIKASSGNVLFNNKSLDKVRHEVSVVFDVPPLYSHLTGRDNLKVLSGVNNLSKISKKYLDILSIDENFLSLKGKSYSLGQRHRLAIAIALIRNPKYLILDEPFIGLDMESYKSVKESLVNISKNGCTVILTGQEYNHMDNFLDEVIILNNGYVKNINISTKLNNYILNVKCNNMDKLIDYISSLDIEFNLDNDTLKLSISNRNVADDIIREINNLGLIIENLHLDNISLSDLIKI